MCAFSSYWFTVSPDGNAYNNPDIKKCIYFCNLGGKSVTLNHIFWWHSEINPSSPLIMKLKHQMYDAKQGLF